MKRVVAVPRDRVRFDGGALVVNGERVTGDREVDVLDDSFDRSLSIREESLGGQAYQIALTPERPYSRDYGPVVVEPGRYFLLGDNRDNSRDSRAYGTVRREDIHGPLASIYWSWDNRETWASMLNPVVWWRLLTEKIRWDRIGTRVD